MHRAAAYMKQNAVAFLSLFVALGGTGAYAANTITGGDIVDDSVTSADIRDDTLGFGGLGAQDLGPGSVGSSEIKDNSVGGGDIGDNGVSSADIRDDNLGFGGLFAQDLGAGSVRSSEVADNSLTGADIQNESIDGIDIIDGKIGGNDIDDGTVSSADIADNTITGADVNESTLNLPNGAAGFAVQSQTTNPTGVFNNEFVPIATRRLPAGFWAVAASATSENVGNQFLNEDRYNNIQCELRDPSGNVIGGTTDRRFIRARATVIRSLSATGGAGVPPGGGDVGLWCRSSETQERVTATLTYIQVDHFL